jgi:hypothetical protein
LFIWIRRLVQACGVIGKDVEIIMEKGQVSQALFQSLGPDGIDWLFIVGCDGDWTITRNGNEVGRGTGEQASLSAGLRNFLNLTHVSAGAAATCDPAVGRLLDRIEREAPATVNVPKYRRRIRTPASKDWLEYLIA